MKRNRKLIKELEAAASRDFIESPRTLTSVLPVPELQKLTFSIRNKSQRSARLGNKAIGKGDMRRGHPEMDNL